jgi:hypothetical protein
MSSHHAFVPEGRLYVDSDFLNEVQHKMSGVHLMHIGFGDFDMSSPAGTISFRRSSDGVADEVMPLRVGRAHTVDGPQEAIAAMLRAMTGCSEDISR